MLLDVREVCSFSDFFVICSAESKPQMQAVCEEIEKAVGHLGASLHHREGKSESGWVLLDFGDLVVHVFSPAERAYYQLEALWSKGIPLVRMP